MLSLLTRPLFVTAVLAVAVPGALPAAASATPAARAASVVPDGVLGGQGEVTLWRGESVACPPTVSTSRRPGAIVGGDHEECFLLTHRVMRVDRVGTVLAAPEPGGRHWEVDLTLAPGQRRAFARVTSAAIGHELAVLDDDRLMSAPLVMDPVVSGALSVDGLTESEAQSLARDLTRSE